MMNISEPAQEENGALVPHNSISEIRRRQQEGNGDGDRNGRSDSERHPMGGLARYDFGVATKLFSCLLWCR